MIDKVEKVIWRGHLEDGFVSSYFPVPKGEEDIKVVYDATQCGLNESLWSPNFILPTIDSVLWTVEIGCWFGDDDLGEMFLNYMLDESLKPYAGIDCTEAQKAIWKEELAVEMDNKIKNHLFIKRLEKNLKRNRL